MEWVMGSYGTLKAQKSTNLVTNAATEMSTLIRK